MSPTTPLTEVVQVTRQFVVCRSDGYLRTSLFTPSTKDFWGHSGRGTEQLGVRDRYLVSASDSLPTPTKQIRTLGSGITDPTSIEGALTFLLLTSNDSLPLVDDPPLGVQRKLREGDEDDTTRDEKVLTEHSFERPRVYSEG